MMLNMIEFVGTLELECSWKWKVAKIMSNFMESFTALAGVVSTSVAQACKMEKKEQKDEQTIASAPDQNHVTPFLVHQRDYVPEHARRCCSHQDRGTREWQAYVRDYRQQGTFIRDTGYAHLYSEPKGIRSRQTRSTPDCIVQGWHRHHPAS